MPSTSDAATRILSPSRQGWQSLRLIGGLAALLAAFVFRRWLSAEFSMLQSLGIIRFRLQSEPTTPLDWFTVLHSHRFVGLVLLNAFDLVNYLLAALMYLGIYSSLRVGQTAYLRVAMGCTAVGTAIYLSSNQALTMLSLSNQYFTSGNDGGKQLLLAAGQYALSVNNPVAFGTAVFWSYQLLYLGGLILSIAMVVGWKSRRWIGIMGVIANGFGLSYFVTSMLGSSFGLISALGSAPTNLVWYLAVGIHLLKNGDGQSKESGKAVHA